MATYPGGIPSLTRPTSGDQAAGGGSTDLTVVLDAQADEIEALATELGTDPAGASATVKARLEAIESSVTSGLATKAPLASPALTGSPTLNGLALNASPEVVDITRGSDATITTTTMAGSEDTVLTVPLDVDEVWDIDVLLYFDAETDVDVKVSFIVPSGATIYGWAQGIVSTATSNAANINSWVINASGIVQVHGTLNTASYANPISLVRGTVRVTCGATSGAFEIQRAKNATGTGNLTLKSYSNVVAIKKA